MVDLVTPKQTALVAHLRACVFSASVLVLAGCSGGASPDTASTDVTSADPAEDTIAPPDPTGAPDAVTLMSPPSAPPPLLGYADPTAPTLPLHPQLGWSQTDLAGEPVAATQIDQMLVVAVRASSGPNGIVALDRQTGETLWSLEADESRIPIEVATADDALLAVSADSSFEQTSIARLDLATGQKLWERSSPLPLAFVYRGRLIERSQDGQTLRSIDLKTGEDNLELSGRLRSGLGFVTTSEGAATVIDFSSLEPIGEPIPLGPTLDRSAPGIVLDTGIATVQDDLLISFDPSGTPIGQIDLAEFSEGPVDVGPMLSPVIGSDTMFTLFVAGSVLTFTAAGNSQPWQPGIFPSSIGVQDERPIGIAESTTEPNEFEIVDMQTTAGLCTVNTTTQPTVAQNGLFAAGAAFGYDCQQWWQINTGADTVTLAVGAGILVANTSDNTWSYYR